MYKEDIMVKTAREHFEKRKDLIEEIAATETENYDPDIIDTIVSSDETYDAIAYWLIKTEGNREPNWREIIRLSFLYKHADIFISGLATIIEKERGISSMKKDFAYNVFKRAIRFILKKENEKMEGEVLKSLMLDDTKACFIVTEHLYRMLQSGEWAKNAFTIED